MWPAGSRSGVEVYQQEKIRPYTDGRAKGEMVEEMFDHISPTYDTLNHRLSWGIDRGWRRRAIRALAPHRPQSLLDIATGTGDFAILAARMLRPVRVVGADFSEGMMRIGREKVAREGLADVVSFDHQDCMHLTYADGTFDAVTAAFGIRNFQDLDRGLREMCRVLRAGGHLSIVELTTPVATPLRQLFRLYAHTVLPLYGRLISRDRTAYSYLTATIEAFPQGERMVEILRRTGFSEARFERLTGGICTMYVATK